MKTGKLQLSGKDPKDANSRATKTPILPRPASADCLPRVSLS